MKYAVFETDGVLRQRLVGGIHEIPDGAVEVDDVLFQRLLNEQDGVWMLDDNVIVKRPLPVSVPDYVQIERTWRDEQLQATEWLATRHRDEVDLQRIPTLIEEHFIELLTYRQALRDWPAAGAFPDSRERPPAPPWIEQQIP